MKKLISIIVITGMLVVIGCNSDLNGPQEAQLKTRMDTISYIIGLDYGIGVREERIDANPLAVYKGFVDGLNDTSVLLDSVKNLIIDEFNEELKVQREGEAKRFLDKNKEDGEVFMDYNLGEDGIIQLSSGLQYKILKEGRGLSPSKSDSVNVHYRAMFVDRTVFDMSYDRGPAGIRINNVINGLSEGIQLMKPGAIYELYIPPGLAYGDQNFANVIPPGSTLIYTIELIEIIKE
ncbi:MAG: FKBP-type peptidyl-prolyl cis-trans isomerase [Bacteroidales bacterium]|nr:FKBP-type peptidyl-prolyl cis-trans isomerase [Bacteroidales bacterium]